MTCLRRLVLWSFLAAALVSTSVLFAWAQGRGISVKVRAENDPNAPVAENVQLYDNSYALVIGNDDYQAGWPKLSKAVSDAKEVAEELEKRGFEVTFKKNLDSAGMQQALKEFFALKGADPKARLFLWYAGHGHTLKDEGFLVPVDAPPPTSPQFKLKAIHMRDFGGFMRLAESKHVFAVFDSCFSGTIFQTRAGMVPAAITRATTKPVRQFMTSGDADQEVSDDGTFRKLFLRALRGEGRADANGDGYLLGTELGLYLSSEVTNITEQTQTPRYGKLRDADYNRGDFVFLLPGRADGGDEAGEKTETGDAGASTPSPGEDQMVEISLWASIAADDDVAQFEAYLEKYPDGHFASVARRKIETLKAEGASKKEETPAKPAAVEPKDETPLKLASGSKLVKSEGSDQALDWSPKAPSQEEKPMVLAAETELDPLFAGTGKPVVLKKDADIPRKKAAGMTDGYAVDPNAWTLSDPQGDSLYKVDGKWIHMRVNGGHNIWDCNRGTAPILWVKVPAGETWTAQVKFEMPKRLGRSHCGLVLWNGRKDRPVNALYVGPADTTEVQAAGSYRENCRSGPGNLADAAGSEGHFRTRYTGASGWLRLSRQGNRVFFYFKSPHEKQWRFLGSALVEKKDGFSRVGLMGKTWGNEPLQVSFSDFRIMPGLSDVKRWVPAYFSVLEKEGVKRFNGQDYRDFEWSDPQGDSVHEIVGKDVRIKANGGHNMWDCKRDRAPVLSVEMPPADTWTAQVAFDMPTRIGRSHAGLAIWNGREERPSHILIFGPADTKEIQVAGSYRDSCRSGPNELRHHEGNDGYFKLAYDRARGWLRISRNGNHYAFYFKSPHEKQWRKLGTLLATVKDGFSRIGFAVKTWGSQPAEVTFSDFTIMTGVAGVKRWMPAYFSRLENGKPEVFSGEEYSDFEWSDPQGDSFHRITGASVQMKVNGGHNMWDCKRDRAPILSVEMPPRDTWVAQVDFNMPKRVGRSVAGMVIWNGREERPVYVLSFGPTETGTIQVSGSCRDSCRSGSRELAAHSGSSGKFEIKSDAASGRLRIIKAGNSYRFALKTPKMKGWQDIGRFESTVKDGFKRIGMMAKTWGSEPVEMTFSNFTILPGGWN